MTSSASDRPVLVIVAYKPKPGKDAELLALTREHLPLLRAEGLATSRPATVCQAADGTLIEVFEWHAGGAQKAHSNPRVLELWGRYSAVCEAVPLNTIEESKMMFAGFTPIEL